MPIHPTMIRPGQVVALCALAALCLGVVMVNSADLMVARVDSMDDQPERITLASILDSRVAKYMLLAIAAMAVGAFLPVRALSAAATGLPARRLFWPLLIISVGVLLAFCALVYMPGISDPKNGAYRWIKLGPGADLSMQPSEVAKWALVPIVAWYAALRARELPRLFSGLIPAMAVIGLIAGFIIIEDLGTGVLLAVVACTVLLAGGASLWQFIIFVALGASGLAAAILTSTYRTNRVRAFLDPYQNPETIGFHSIQSLIAIHNGRGFGTGLGEGLQKRGYLPEDRTDYIFAIICEELGIAGASLVIFIFIALIIAGITIARRERDHFLRLWAVGIIATVGLQALMNLYVVTGMAPPKGIALPLISYGGTGWVLTAFSLGLLISIARSQPQSDERPQTAAPPGLLGAA
jgi:cell division protein FtsW